MKGRSPQIGLWGGAEHAEALLCFRVADLDGALRRVRELGGQAGAPTVQPYGRLAECQDDQGLRFQLFEAPVR